MKSNKKNNLLSCDSYNFKPIEDKNLKARLAKDPFFVKKHEEAQRQIDKYGLPQDFLEDKK